ncbi:MAG: hypothetical protein IB618_01040 [Candidatus Pacearchaeota archaeon]|nr:MAG: hypothetical protein IB618_01040 [Candidatus Pacearchaeota archaeon]
MDNEKLADIIWKGFTRIVLPAALLAIVGKGIYDIGDYKKSLNNPDSIATYVIKPGDGLDIIGLKEGFCPSWMRIDDWRCQVAKMNDRKHNPDSLVPGETLTLPFYEERR